MHADAAVAMLKVRENCPSVALARMRLESSAKGLCARIQQSSCKGCGCNQSDSAA